MPYGCVAKWLKCVEGVGRRNNDQNFYKYDENYKPIDPKNLNTPQAQETKQKYTKTHHNQIYQK